MLKFVRAGRLRDCLVETGKIWGRGWERNLSSIYASTLDLLFGLSVSRPVQCPQCGAPLQPPSSICVNCGNDAEWERWAEFARNLESSPEWLRVRLRRKLYARERAYVDALLNDLVHSREEPPKASSKWFRRLLKKWSRSLSQAGPITLFSAFGYVPCSPIDHSTDAPSSTSPEVSTTPAAAGEDQSDVKPQELVPLEILSEVRGLSWQGDSPSDGAPRQEAIPHGSNGTRVSEEFRSSAQRDWKESIRRSESRRKEIFRELVRAGLRARKKAAAKYPTDPSVTSAWQENVYKQIDVESDLRRKYDRRVGKKYGVTAQELRNIVLEGQQKSWPEHES